MDQGSGVEEEEDEVFFDALDSELLPNPKRISGAIHMMKRSMTPTQQIIPNIAISTPSPLSEPEIDEAESTFASGTSVRSMTRSTLNSLGTSLMTLELSAQTRCQKVRVKAKGKSRPSFADLYLVQELLCHQDDIKLAVYAMKFSPDGRYLAAGCSDGSIRVWTLLVEELLQLPEGTENLPKAAAIFCQDPSMVLLGHEGEVVDLSWSCSSNAPLLLSASTDSSIRLWSPTRSDCLAIFPHPDLVTSVAFHPRNDRLFISGALDCRVRLWNIEERRVMGWNELPAENLITAVAWTRNGRYALAGSSTGVLLFFDSDGFKYYTQILVKSSRGRNAVGKKISSIQIKPGGPIRSPPLPSETGKKRAPSDEQEILVSSNDSRLRAYNLRDKSEAGKYLGHVNESSQIKATYSDDAEFIISGSEDGKCLVWAADQPKKFKLFAKDARFEAYDVFYPASSSLPCTAAIIAPASVQGRLQSTRMRPAIPPDSSVHGRIIVTADTEGRIRVFENNAGLPAWLDASDSIKS